MQKSRIKLETFEPNIYLDTNGKTPAFLVTKTDGGTKRFSFDSPEKRKTALANARQLLRSVNTEKGRYKHSVHKRARLVQSNRNKRSSSLPSGVLITDSNAGARPLRYIEIFLDTEPAYTSGRMMFSFLKSPIREDIVIAWACAIRAEFLESGEPIKVATIKQSWKYLLAHYGDASLSDFLLMKHGWWDL